MCFIGDIKLQKGDKIFQVRWFCLCFVGEHYIYRRGTKYFSYRILHVFHSGRYIVEGDKMFQVE